MTTAAPATAKPTISVVRPALVVGQAVTMTWSTTDATSLTHVCTASGTGYTVNESVTVIGSRAITPLAAWVGYPSSCTWTATGGGGTTTYADTMTTTQSTSVGVTYIHTDGLGSPVARTDSSGTLISRTYYEPYGYVASGAVPTIGFTGHVNDADTGLTYMEQRYYDPVAGRFVSVDPIMADEKTGDVFNRYVYSINNPYKYIDPDGRQIVKVIVDVVKAVIKAEGKPVAKDAAKQASRGAAKEEGKAATSNAARREVMREQGIPTSQQPKSQSQNESGREYTYETPKSGGGTETKSVQQQTMDSSHQGEPHWEAGKVKTDPRTGDVRETTYGRPKLQNDKSKVDYNE